MKTSNLLFINNYYKAGKNILNKLSDDDFENNFYEIIDQVFAEMFLEN